MKKAKILVTAATGRTGMATVKDLLKRGHPVRALVRKVDARSAALKEAGAEIFIGDLNDFRDLRGALHGVQRAYHCPPFATNLLHNTMLFAIAAEEAKLEVVVLMSQWQPHEAHPSIVSREHWISNQIYRWMPSVDVVHLNPGLFAFTYLLGLPAAVHFGVLMLPFGKALNAPVSNEDIAGVAASILANPTGHIGRNYRPTGPKLISPSEVADVLTSLLGRKVKYNAASFKMFTKAAVAQGFPLQELAHLRHYARDLKDGAFALGAPTEHVLEVTGHEPEPFEVTAKRYVENPSLVHPALKLGSRLQALGFLARMLATPAPDLDAWEQEQGYPLLKNPQPSINNPVWKAAAERQQLNLLDLKIHEAAQPVKIAV